MSMINEEYLMKQILIPALKFLPPQLDSINVRVLLLSIGFQESGFVSRVQVKDDNMQDDIVGKGFYQFTYIACKDVYEFQTNRFNFLDILNQLRIQNSARAVHTAIQFHDILATITARIFLYQSPLSVPCCDDYKSMWYIYKSRWRPGRPRRENWDTHCKRAKEIVIKYS